MILQKSWSFSSWERVSQSPQVSSVKQAGLRDMFKKPYRTIAASTTVVSSDPLSYSINFHSYDDSWSTVSLSFSISDRKLRESRKQRRWLWCPWTSSWRRDPTGRIIWLDVQPKHKADTKSHSCWSVWKVYHHHHLHHDHLDPLLAVHQQVVSCQHQEQDEVDPQKSWNRKEIDHVIQFKFKLTCLFTEVCSLE